VTSETRGLKNIVASFLLCISWKTHTGEASCHVVNILKQFYGEFMWHGPEASSNGHVSEPSSKTNLKPWSSCQVTEAPTDVLIATSCENLTQNHTAKLLLNSLPSETAQEINSCYLKQLSFRLLTIENELLVTRGEVGGGMG